MNYGSEGAELIFTLTR